MSHFTPSRILLVTLLTFAGALPAAAQNSGRNQQYSMRDAGYVTDSRNSAVLDYVVCLQEAFSGQPRRLAESRAIDNAIISCRNAEYEAANNGGRRDIASVQQAIRDCGFRPADARPGMRCGNSNQAAGNGNTNGGYQGPPRYPSGQGGNSNQWPNGNQNNGQNNGQNSGRNSGGTPRMDTNGFPVDAVSLGGRVRIGPSIHDEQASSTLVGQDIQLLGNAGSTYAGYPWFTLRLNDGQIAYQWGGGICMPRHPIDGIKGICDPQIIGAASNPNPGNGFGGGSGNGFGGGRGNPSATQPTKGNDAADMVIGILDIFSQLAKNKNDKNNNHSNPNTAIVEQELTVTPGGGVANAQGSLNREQLAIYSVRGRKGQSLKVDVSSTNDKVVFEIYINEARDGGTTLRGAGQNENATSFDGVLPQNGSYKIVVGSRTNATSYRLAVSLEQPGRANPGNGSNYDPRNDKFVGTYESTTGQSGNIERNGNGLIWTYFNGRGFPLSVDWANRRLVPGNGARRSFDVDFRHGRVTGFRYGRDYYTRSANRILPMPVPGSGAGNGGNGQGRADDACKLRNQVASTSKRAGSKVTFTNNRNSEIRVYWIGYDGKEGEYGGSTNPQLTLQPGQRTQIDSRLGFAFVAVNRRGKCIDLVQTTRMYESHEFDR